MQLEGAHPEDPIGRRPGRLRLPLGFALLGLVLVACQRDEVAHFRVPKGPISSVAASMAPGMDMGGGGDAVPPPPTPSGALRWTLPSGWSEGKGGGPMRYATLVAPVLGKVDVSVIVLPGPAGGELANVNRWRNQIGLPPYSEAELPGSRKVLHAKVGDLRVYDFTSEGTKKTRTIAGLTTAEGNTWFVKMTGDAEAVASAGPAFLELLGSLRLEER